MGALGVLLLAAAGVLAYFYFEPTPAEAAIPPADTGSDAPPLLDVVAPSDFAAEQPVGTGLDSVGLDPRSYGTTFSAALAPLAAELGYRVTFTGAAGRLPRSEQDTIDAVAAASGVDAVALAAIRLQENGAPGREFGVLSALSDPAYIARVAAVGTFQAQAEWAAGSLKKNETRYTAATGRAPKDGSGHYTPDYWQFFGGRWAPIGAANDPRGLNQFWVSNVIGFYQGSGLA